MIGHDGAAPKWLASWSPRAVRLAPGGATSGAAVVLATRKDLERFLAEGAPHERTVLLWPRNKEAKTFEALSGVANGWLKTVDAHADLQRGGEVFEVHQVQG